MSLISDGLGFLHKVAGNKCSIKYYDIVCGSVWDDETTLTLSGNALWTSGIYMGVSPDSSEDSVLLEQGKIALSDKKLFLSGSIPTQTGSTSVKIQLGSPTGVNYYINYPGVDSATWAGQDVFKKVYIRALTAGSLYGE